MRDSRALGALQRESCTTPLRRARGHRPPRPRRRAPRARGLSTTPTPFPAGNTAVPRTMWRCSAARSHEDPSPGTPALAEQRAALEDLKRQLTERVAAVKEREDRVAGRDRHVAAGRERHRPPSARRSRADRLAARTAALASGSASWRHGRRPGGGVRRTAPATRRTLSVAALGARGSPRGARAGARRARARVQERERIPLDPDAARLARSRPGWTSSARRRRRFSARGGSSPTGATPSTRASDSSRSASASSMSATTAGARPTCTARVAGSAAWSSSGRPRGRREASAAASGSSSRKAPDGLPRSSARRGLYTEATTRGVSSVGGTGLQARQGGAIGAQRDVQAVLGLPARWDPCRRASSLTL